ncbi:hypothetical protein HJG60_011367 [Phyllostomus discolor]|uniref:Uncharacterized protein n=1 Tax=Phyllostomus discolor TaxID=89673 RepID=A0A834E7S9_9CHIR|nr:hypothetical protein HJG60_011367 [Phyllostomus discolor]
MSHQPTVQHRRNMHVDVNESPVIARDQGVVQTSRPVVQGSSCLTSGFVFVQCWDPLLRVRLRHLLGTPLPGLTRRASGDPCLQKSLVAPPGPDTSQAPHGPPSLRWGCPGLGGVGGDFSGCLSDHKSRLIAEFPPTEAQCLPGRLSPGNETSGRPGWRSATQGPLPGCGLQGPDPRSQATQPV